MACERPKDGKCSLSAVNHHPLVSEDQSILPVGRFIKKNTSQEVERNIKPKFTTISMGAALDTCLRDENHQKLNKQRHKDDNKSNCLVDDEIHLDSSDTKKMIEGHGRNPSLSSTSSSSSSSASSRKSSKKSNVSKTISNGSTSLVVEESHHGDGRTVVDVTSEVEEEEEVDHDVTIQHVINDVWKKINEGLPNYKHEYEKLHNVSQQKKGWKIIRLFISSTFTDFHSEREILIKKVMPELREWCEQFKVHLLECDLRWGVPKNTNTEETISICLDEIDRCISESNGQPFFLNMLGERYGWIPTLDFLSDELLTKYDWIYPISITHMEILHAVLRTNSPNSLFMIRNEESLHNLPDNFEKFFKDDKTLAQSCLKRLKSELSSRYPSQTFEYQSTISGIDNSTGMEKIAFENLDEFASKVVEFYKTRITEYLSTISSEDDSELTEMDQFSLMQDTFIAKRGQWLIGRDEEVEAMMNFVTNQNRDDDERCLLIIAKPGTGKSSLVANHVLKLNEAGIPCLYNFSSSSPGSTNSNIVLQRFCEDLSKKLKTDPPEEDKKDDYEYLKTYFHENLKKISEQINGFTIVLDAVNQFSDMLGKQCDWLPLPAEDLNVRYIISCTPTYDGITSLKEKFKDISKEILLTGFNMQCRQELTESLFSRYNKKLDAEQLSMLISLDAASSPLWLALACEELRVFGVFEQVTERIRNLPDSITGLMQIIFDRMIAEDETNKLKPFLCYMALCLSGGFTESELRHFLRDDDESTDPLPMMIWAKVKRQLKAFLMTTGTSVPTSTLQREQRGFQSITLGNLPASGDEEIFTFFHAAVKQTINSAYLTDSTNVKEYHHQIALYMLHDTTHVITRYVSNNAIFHHLQYAGMYKEMIQYARNDQRGRYVSNIQKGIAFSKVRCQAFMPPGNSPFKTAIHTCNMCSMKSKILSQVPMLTKDLCIICGGHTPFKKPEHQAFVCQKHKSFTAPKTDKCYFCKRVIFLEQKTAFPLYHKCYLCVMCGNKSQCVQLTC